MAGQHVTPGDYSAAAGPYGRLLLQARRQFARQEVVTTAEISAVYRRAARRVRQRLAGITSGTLRAGYLAQLAKILEHEADLMQGQIDQVLRVGIRAAVLQATAPAEQLGLRLFAGVFRQPEVRAMFASINEQAVAAVLSRTHGDGLGLSDRIWRITRTWERSANRLIEDMVASGQNAREAARQIDRYLQPRTHTALKIATRRRLGVPRDVSMESMRLAVTELNTAYHEGSIAAHAATPSLQGYLWRLSNAHTVEDVCDDLATTKQYGEPGFYPPDKVPPNPHPWCRCQVLPKMEQQEAFVKRLTQWVDDPQSQPKLEKWYIDIAKPYIARP